MTNYNKKCQSGYRGQEATGLIVVVNIKILPYFKMLDEIKKEFNKKDVISFLLMAIMLLAIPITVKIAREQQILFSKANAAKIEFLTKDLGGTGCVVQKDGKLVAVCSNISLRITAPTGSDLQFRSQNASLPQGRLVSKVYAQEACNWRDAGYREDHDGENCQVWTDGCNNWD
ncbi:hypothetical protein HYW43_00220, partial [Candidatus Daviesbacteria bacterium]|nr:hypothetical protein [Candidatus Daviesbacteria bacterium]